MGRPDPPLSVLLCFFWNAQPGQQLPQVAYTTYVKCIADCPIWGKGEGGEHRSLHCYFCYLALHNWEHSISCLFGMFGQILLFTRCLRWAVRCLMEFLAPANLVAPQKLHTTWVHSLSMLTFCSPSQTSNDCGIDPTSHTYRFQSSPNLVPTPLNDRLFYETKLNTSCTRSVFVV